MTISRTEESLHRANALLTLGRFGDAVALMESALGLAADDYRDPARLAEWCGDFFEPREDEFLERLTLLLSLLSGLGLVYRLRDGQRLLAAILEIEPAALEDSEKVARSFETSRLPRDPAFRVAFAMAAATQVAFRERSWTGLGLLEGAVGLEKEDYAEPDRCARRLGAGLDGVPLDVRIAWLILLAGQLLGKDRTEDALALFAADLGVSGSFTSHPTAFLVHALRARLAGVSGQGQGTYARGLARTLAASGEPGYAVAVLEVYADLDPPCYERPALLASRLHQLVSRTTHAIGLSFVSELIGNLKEDGQLARAALLLRVYVDRFVLGSETVGSFEDPPVPDFTALFELWLEFFGDEIGSRPLDICRRLVEQICGSLGQASELEDRQALLHTLGSLRRRLLTVGHRRAAREDDAGRRRGLFRELAIWDAELSQRLLLERLRLGERQTIAVGEPPIPGRQVADRLRDQAKSKGDLLRGVHGYLSDAESGLLAGLSGLEASGPAEEMPARQASEASLAAALGRDTLFLRATFDPSGRLLWTLYDSDGERLENLGFGAGRESDLGALRWAVARHDFALELVHSRVVGGPAARAFSRDLNHLQYALELLSDTLRIESEASTEQSRSLLKDFESIFMPPSREVADLVADASRHAEKSLDQPLKRSPKSLAQRLFPLLWRPLLASRPDDTAGRMKWAQSATTRVEEIRALTLSIATSAESRARALDSATRRYLDEVSAIWPLDGLALPAERDIVLQVDELLHSVPLALLPVAGRPLYQQVRSARTSLSLLMDVWQDEQEQSARPSPRLLTLSYNPPEDPVLGGMAALHHGLTGLGEQLDLETWGGDADLPATAGTLRAALDAHRGFDVVAICGHGHAVRAGVILGAPDGDPEGALWQGAGCDLSGVGWLFLVSCSIGRVKQTGERDAEGLAVELALHGARSVAAFRWPISSREAAAFATEAIGRYLRGRRRGMNGLVRARALNDARRALLDGGTDLPNKREASLHTIAACELYGLG